MAQYAYHTAIGLLYTGAIREFFASNKLTQNYRWSTDPEKRAVEIDEQWPVNAQKFPLIIVDTVYTNEGEHYLSDGAHDITVNDVQEGQFKSGSDNFDVRISVNADSKPEADEIGELLLFGLRAGDIDNDVIQKSLMTVIPQHGVRSAGAGARPFTDMQLIYFVTVSQAVKTHWFQEVLYEQKIQTYLATVERDSIVSGQTTSFQIQAGD